MTLDNQKHHTIIRPLPTNIKTKRKFCFVPDTQKALPSKGIFSMKYIGAPKILFIPHDQNHQVGKGAYLKEEGIRKRFREKGKAAQKPGEHLKESRGRRDHRPAGQRLFSLEALWHIVVKALQ